MKNSLGIALGLLVMGHMAAQAQTELGFWNFNSYDPSADTSSLADSGAQTGTASFDWSSFGTTNVVTPAIGGSTINAGTNPSGNGLGLLSPVTPTPRFIDISADLTGLDLPILYFAGSRGASSLSGEWSYSINGGTTFTSAGNRSLPVGDYGQNTVIFSPLALRNQSDVVLRYTFSGVNQPVQLDNVQLIARDATNIIAYAVNGVRTGRAMAGRTTDLDFVISERTGTNQQYSLAGSNLNIFGPSSGILFSGSGSIVDGQADLTNASAGDLVTSTLQVTNTTASQVSTASVTFQAVDNREMSSTNGDFGDIGRIVRGTEFATPLIISGGAATDAEATRVTLREGTFATSGLTFTSSGNVFDSSNETAGIQVAFSDKSALGERTISLTGLNPLRQDSSFNQNGPRLFVGENLQGESLNLAGVTLNVTATVLENRGISGEIVDLGREMVSTGTATATGTISATIGGDSRSDLQGTRVSLAGDTVGSLVADGVSVTTTATNFNAANVSSQATVNYNFQYNRSVTGSNTRSVNVAGLLSDGELPSAGATVDDFVDVGVIKTIVADRVVTSITPNNIDILENSSVTVSKTFYTAGDDNHFTRVTVNGVLFDSEDDFITSRLLKNLHTLAPA